MAQAILDRSQMLDEYFACMNSLNSYLKQVGGREIRLDADAVARVNGDSDEALQIQIQKMRGMVSVLEGAVRVLGLHPSHFYLRSALKKFGWRIDAEAFDSIRETDTIEIYGLDLSLKVANLRFIELCSYSFDQVMRHTFFELFDRDADVTEKFIGIAQRILSGVSGTIRELGPPHVVRERFSDQRAAYLLTPRLATPVFSKDGAIEGFLFSATLEA